MSKYSNRDLAHYSVEALYLDAILVQGRVVETLRDERERVSFRIVLSEPKQIMGQLYQELEIHPSEICKVFE